MPENFHLETLRFAEPQFLWLLWVPAGLCLMLVWRIVRRRRDLAKCAIALPAPLRNRPGLLGDLAPWLPVALAAAACIVALAQPQALAAVIDKSGVDLVILQDASASMHVEDVPPNRWQRSQQFVRVMAAALRWEGDRAALALFAHRTAPQLRLTRDPNSLLFFLDHLGEVPPFPLEDDTTWNTNIAEAVLWGLKLIEKNEELFGRSNNARAFLLISDGQAWSGELDSALAQARARDVKLYVVGVGTVTGGLIPQPRGDDGRLPDKKIRGTLDRTALRYIARQGGGQYFELGVAPDRDTAFSILAAARQHASGSQVEERVEPLYWYALLAAVLSACLAGVLASRAIERRWLLGGAVATLCVLILRVS
jgi:Ca-activated chloride channel family protein